MHPDDQQEVIRFLEAPATHGGRPVERIDTHSSIVFLAGARALKLKRAVRYDYLDFSSVALRRAMCERELLINRRTAPSIYHRVVPVTRRADGGLTLDGDGAAVDWLVDMQRFDGEGLLDRLAAQGRLALETMVPLAAAIAALHAAAAPRREFGGHEGLAWTIDGNAASFAAAPGVFDTAAAAAMTIEAREVLDRDAVRLDARRAAGFVRQCHGDLHLRNIVLLDGVPTLFDAIEFNDQIACIDVMYDLAFLLMDLWRRSLPGHANTVLNAYLEITGDRDALALLPLFLSCRAAIRAKTSASAAALASERREDLERTAREYLAMAGVLLRPAAPRIVAVGGLSGSGKSTIARTVAPSLGAVPGAVIVRSDVVRKRLAGVGPLTRLAPEHYTTGMSARVYASAIAQARQIAATGHSAIVDAVFARVSDRLAIEQAARSAGVPFTGLWLEAPADALEARVRGRHGDASDASAEVVRAQVAAGVGDVGWHRLDASRDATAVGESALRLLRRPL